LVERHFLESVSKETKVEYARLTDPEKNAALRIFLQSKDRGAKALQKHFWTFG